MPLKVNDWVYCTLNAKLELYEVSRIVKKGRPPRYELTTLDRRHIRAVPIENEDEWLGSYIFTDIEQALQAIQQGLQDELEQWETEMFQGKDKLAQYLFDMWVSIDSMLGYSPTGGEQNHKLKRLKLEKFAEKMKEYFGVDVVVPGTLIPPPEYL